MTLWLYLHFPALQLNTLFCESQKQAIIVVDGRGNQVVQCNAFAADNGIKKGMGLGSASALCRELQVHAYDFESEKVKLKEIAHWLYIVTSDISFCTPNGLLLRASNMLALHDGLSNYWRTLKAHLDVLQLNYTYATAYSPLAARLLARTGLNLVTDKADTLFTELKKCPLSMAVSEVELSTKQVDQLSRVGVKTFNDLLSIPTADLANRFGVEMVNYVGRLKGLFHHPVHFYYPPERFSQYLEMLFDVENISFLVKPLRKLLSQLEAFLTIRGQFAHELSLVLHQRDQEDCLVTASSSEGESHAEKWASLFELRFESVKLAAPVTGLTLSASRLAAKRDNTADLFDGKQGDVSPQELISILQAKLGPDAVQGIMLTEDARPHLSTQFCKPLQSSVAQPTKSQSRITIPVNKRLLRPSILLPRPQALHEKVTIIQGPERLATGWWDANAMTRDYFIARAVSGRWLWVFRTPEQYWFLHGFFS